MTVDDGDGSSVLSVVVKLAEVDVPPLKSKAKEKDEKRDKEVEGRRTFRSARERHRAPPAAPVAMIGPPAKLYVRPDIRVGDTIRLAGSVEEWMRRNDAIRQVVVDEASGSGFIRELAGASHKLTPGVVDPDEQYTHVQNVSRLHREVYSQPFIMPAPAPPATSIKSSPAKSVASTWDLSSEVDLEDDIGPDLPDPSKLPSSRLTETTFKLYLMDHMVREATKAMRTAMRVLLADPTAQVPELAALFPEYAECTAPPARDRRASPSPSPTPTRRRPTPTLLPRRGSTPEVFAPSHAENLHHTSSCETPRPRSTFRSKAEREAAKAQRPRSRNDHPPLRAKSELEATRTPSATRRETRSTFRSRSERGREKSTAPDSPFLVNDATPRCSADTSFLSRLDLSSSSSYEASTVTSLLAVERLHTLAVRVVDTRARREENERRKRVKEGRTTQRDEALAAARRARGLRSSDYKLTDAERYPKMVRLVEWAIRTAAAEGALVQVDTGSGMHSLRTMGSFDSCASTLMSSEAGYVPVPPELLGPLLIPLAAAERAERASRRSTFRSRAERERDRALGRLEQKEGPVDAKILLRRLRSWGEDGRWERVGEWAVEAAVEWAEAAGLLRLT